MKRAPLLRVYRRLRGGELTLGRATGSVGLGLFIGLLPFYGLHLPLCLGVSYGLKLDGLVAYAAANISNPLFAPFIVMAQIEVGSRLFAGHWVTWDFEQSRGVGWAAFTAHSLGGALIVATVGATLGALLTLGLGLLWRRTRGARPRARCHETSASTERARVSSRIRERYRNTRPQDRHYVRLKLLIDPLTVELERLDGPFGQVTDAGCGRGQFGLWLFELGQVTTLYGFDWDPDKVASANLAAGATGRYVQGDLRNPPFVPTDTVLLFDVLHYLAPTEQRDLLGRIQATLRPGGRLLLRDVDKNHGASAAMTRLFEHLGTGLGMNRAEQLSFRPLEAVARELEQLGLVRETTHPSARPGRLLDNQLLVFRKPATEHSNSNAELVR